MNRHLLGLLLASASLNLGAGCAETPPAPSATLEVEVRPLELDGVAEAVWDLRVANGAEPSQTVFAVRITSSRFGDGAGAATYVGPCDADANDNAIELRLVGIYGSAVGSPGPFGDAAPAGALPVVDPGLMRQTRTCVANGDVSVVFDVTVMRPAGQGFFDIAVDFEDVFCSAKYDCASSPLLFDEGGARGPTHVFGFACTAGPSVSAKTRLHLDDLVLDCGPAGQAVIDPTTGQGNLCAAGRTDLCAAVDDPDELLFQAAIYRGAEELTGMDKRYWNIALGVGPVAASPSTYEVTCTLTTRGTVDDGGLGTPATVAAGRVYPYIDWTIDLADCPASFPLGAGGAPVSIRYTTTGDTTPRVFEHAFGADTGAGETAPPDGDAYAWGAIADGQLGNGATTGANLPSPTLVNGGLRWRSVSANRSGHACGVASDGSGWCWGEDSMGQLGDGVGFTTRSSPALVAGGHVWKHISAGLYHTCGVTQAGEGYCWGDNQFGKLGNNDPSEVDQAVPVLVQGGHEWRQIATGSLNSCGITTGGAAYCWGIGGFGTLGIANPPASQRVPGLVDGGHTWKQIEIGNGHACGVTTLDDAWCWGQNGEGRTGLGLTSGNRNTPGLVLGSLKWRQLDLATSHTCGITTSDVAYCWGSDAGGALGNGAALTNDQTSPSAVAGNLLWTQISAAGGNSCGVTTSGDGYCWGSGSSGANGAGSLAIINQTSPSPITGGMKWLMVVADESNGYGIAR